MFTQLLIAARMEAAWYLTGCHRLDISPDDTYLHLLGPRNTPYRAAVFFRGYDSSTSRECARKGCEEPVALPLWITVRGREYSMSFCEKHWHEEDRAEMLYRLGL